MEYAVKGLNFTPVSKEVFVVMPTLDVNARLPLVDRLVLGSLFAGGQVVLQLVYCPRPFVDAKQGVPIEGFSVLLSSEVATLRWIGSGQPENTGLDVGSVQRLIELRADDQIKNLLATSAYKKAIRELKKMQASGSEGSLWARLRHGSVREKLTSLASMMTKIGAGIALATIVFLLWVRTVDLDLRIQNMGVVNATPAPAQLVQQVASNQLQGPQLMALLELVRGSAISRFSNGDPIVMLSDPNCPACRAFEAQMKKENWPFTPLVIPVAFQAGSADAVAGVLCSKDRAKAWDQALAGKALPGCEQGRQQTALNNEAFSMMQLDSTPTFVSMTGKIFRGASDVAGLLAWAKENAPEGKIGQR